MSGNILKPNDKTIFASTYRPLTPEEYDNQVIKERMDDFNEEIHIKLGPSANPDDFDVELEEFLDDFKTLTYKPYSDKENKMHTIPVRDEIQSFDQYIGAEVLLPFNNRHITGKVCERKRNSDGKPKGHKDGNPMFDTRAYIIEFLDGAEAEYTANIIAENMYAQCNIEGNQYLLHKGIVDQ